MHLEGIARAARAEHDALCGDHQRGRVPGFRRVALDAEGSDHPAVILGDNQIGDHRVLDHRDVHAADLAHQRLLDTIGRARPGVTRAGVFGSVRDELIRASVFFSDKGHAETAQVFEGRSGMLSVEFGQIPVGDAPADAVHVVRVDFPAIRRAGFGIGQRGVKGHAIRTCDGGHAAFPQSSFGRDHHPKPRRGLFGGDGRTEGGSASADDKYVTCVRFHRVKFLCSAKAQRTQRKTG